MSGGEFCGNACRATAMYLQKNFGIKNSVIYINGIKIKAFCNGKKATIQILKNSLVFNINEIDTGIWLIKQKDMTQIVIRKNSPLYKENPTKKYASTLKEKFNLFDVAVGIIFFDGEKQIPFIFVKDVNTFYKETACVSGSISCALTTKNKLNKIKQPSGAIYSVLVNRKYIKVLGNCISESLNCFVNI